MLPRPPKSLRAFRLFSFGPLTLEGGWSFQDSFQDIGGRIQHADPEGDPQAEADLREVLRGLDSLRRETGRFPGQSILRDERDMWLHGMVSVAPGGRYHAM